MAAPPVPPRPMSARPDYFQDEYSGGQHPQRQDSGAPPIPPLPTNYRSDTLSPHWGDPMPAPRPQKIMSNVPSDMAQNLEQGMHAPSSFSMPVPSFSGGFSAPPPPPQGVSYGFRPPLPVPPQHSVPNAYPGPGGFAQQPPAPPVSHHQPTLSITQSFDAMSMGPQPGFTPRQSSLMAPPTPRPLSFAQNIPPPSTPLPQPPAPTGSPAPTFAEPAPGPGQPPAIITPMPTVSTLLAAESKLTKPSHIVAWAKAVLALVDRQQPDADPGSPEPISDPVIARLANVAIQHVLSFASVWQVGSRDPVPPHVAEALYLRGTLEASGAFPEKIPRDQRSAFRDFNEAARQGYKAGWFKIGRDYESVKDMTRAREVFERGAGFKETSCLYRLGMAHLLGQLGFTANPAVAVPLLQEAADLSNVDVPQPAYVFGMLLLGEFAHVQLPPALLAQTLPAPTPQNPHPRASEARRRIERAAFLGYGPALYKIGWGYEHAKMGCAYDPLLSVQYYSSASQRGEAEADMSLSKWFLCGSEGFFEKDENLAVVFAEKAANRKLATGMFAIGYYYEVGVGVKADRNEAIKWYQKAEAAGNNEATGRLTALSAPNAAPLSRAEHETLTDSRLVRRHTKAKDTSAAAGRVAQVKGEEDRKAMEGAAHAAADSDVGQPAKRPGQLPLPGGGLNTPPRVTSPAHAQATSPKRRPQPQGQGAGPGRFQQRYTLTDEGFQTPSSPQVSTPTTAPPQPQTSLPPSGPAPTPASAAPASAPPAAAPAPPSPTAPAATKQSGKKGPQSFAEMGFHSQPVEDKDCVIM
ncbi:Chitin synthase regulatory factor 4 OS=Schizosaccharomyces pombe (strain 972 / ATCC 24843) GN=chr4 PE=1 SV=4 [Rhizoctonia solani AG-1 IB]|uniref:Chitin synthase regulatory factor 4 n=1 Tax=Thanatephorus cucumeris (strain AG1-IB / isolate 7/3/14) TaxID=1108050 RepID=A0A0B7FIY4_THACB|nr:Chitin synthase regulatory factor 4 OS=Schizosaccharomyces pombe (strain 972 / ATCC 24843) GN=chr4 PE=1 SV=4 [Rhizoctonia solani AG-1 IB]